MIYASLNDIQSILSEHVIICVPNYDVEKRVVSHDAQNRRDLLNTISKTTYLALLSLCLQLIVSKLPSRMRLKK